MTTSSGDSNGSEPVSSSSQQQCPSPSSVPVKSHSRVIDWRDAVAGACAGAMAKTAVAPIERVKLLLQLQGMQSVTYGNTAWQVSRTVYQQQGLLAFWRGNTPNVLRQAGTSAINFMLMEHYKKAAVSPLLLKTLAVPSKRKTALRIKRRELWSSFLSGGLAGGTTTTILYPIEFLRTRLALDATSTRHGMRDVFYSVYTTDGIRGLYQGYGIALAGVVLYRALHMGGYDALKTEIQYTSGSTNLSWVQRFVAAQVVSVVAGTLCYPIDSVRRRLMMQAGLPESQRLYKNSVDCFPKVWRREGLRGFYLGLGPNLVRSLGGALLLVSYDVFKVML